MSEMDGETCSGFSFLEAHCSSIMCGTVKRPDAEFAGIDASVSTVGGGAAVVVVEVRVVRC